MLQFLYGAVTLGFLAIGLFFLKFWLTTRDFLFAAFAVSSWLLALDQGLLAVGPSAIPDQGKSWLFLIRLGAFLLIALAILVKNLEHRRRGG